MLAEQDLQKCRERALTVKKVRMIYFKRWKTKPDQRTGNRKATILEFSSQNVTLQLLAAHHFAVSS